MDIQFEKQTFELVEELCLRYFGKEHQDLNGRELQKLERLLG